MLLFYWVVRENDPCLKNVHCETVSVIFNDFLPGLVHVGRPIYIVNDNTLDRHLLLMNGSQVPSYGFIPMICIEKNEVWM